MYDSLNLEDFRHILYIIRDNHKKYDSLTHKEILVYLHCMRELWTELNVPDSHIMPSIKFHFHAMALRISHEKRAFLAEQLLSLLLRLEPKQQSSNSEEFANPKPQENSTQHQQEDDPDDIPFEAGGLLPLNPS
ncbi:hypothetical protein NIES4103_68790 (plasmid) [Nostoc sp. NIES-4103]|nr:hypothetical protein NIES4103_68790 [Nostoc sp. NIES-4103]